MAALLELPRVAAVVIPFLVAAIAVVILARHFGRPQQPLVLPPSAWSVR